MTAAVDNARRATGYLTAAELVAALPGVLVLDPDSTMVSPGLAVEAGAVLYPGVVLRAVQGRITIGGWHTAVARHSGHGRHRRARPDRCRLSVG